VCCSVLQCVAVCCSGSVGMIHLCVYFRVCTRVCVCVRVCAEHLFWEGERVVCWDVYVYIYIYIYNMFVYVYSYVNICACECKYVYDDDAFGVSLDLVSECLLVYM